jgi:hypothetical protein
MPERAIPELSDLLTRALINRDFALYAQVTTLPLRITPRGAKPYVLATQAELRADFDLYVDIMRLHGVTDIYRKLLGITRTDTGVEARWLTHILVRARLLAEPFETRMKVVKGEGGWKIAEIESSEGHINWTLGRAEVSDGQFTRKETP